MISNLPTKDDFVKIAKECLNQAFRIVYDIDHYLIEVDINPQEVWRYQLNNLNTTVVLIHQAIESLLKAEICSVSPFLLIDAKREDWPTMPASGDKDFNEIYSIGGESLIRTYCAVKADKPDNAVVKFVEEIRLSRNRIVHSLSRVDLSPQYLIEAIMQTYTLFIGKNSCFESIRKMVVDNPLNNAYDDPYNEGQLVEYWDYIKRVVRPSELVKHFNLNLKARRYLCPNCYLNIQVEGYTTLASNWAVLTPQRVTGVNTLTCVCCGISSDVIRKECESDNCKGDVLFESEYDYDTVCATCGLHQGLTS